MSLNHKTAHPQTGKQIGLQQSGRAATNNQHWNSGDDPSCGIQEVVLIVRRSGQSGRGVFAKQRVAHIKDLWLGK
jgi:hypothetical protein